MELQWEHAAWEQSQKGRGAHNSLHCLEYTGPAVYDPFASVSEVWFRFTGGGGVAGCKPRDPEGVQIDKFRARKYRFSK